jgi:hypothetical protein
MSTSRRISKRDTPYDKEHERKRIATAHSKRLTSLQKKLGKLDDLHPSAYGISIVKPEFGFWKVAVSGLLEGFEVTQEYRTFLIHLERFATKGQAATRTLQQPRYPIPTTRFNEIYDTLSSKTSKEEVRRFLQLLKKNLEYQPSTPLSKLTVPLLLVELNQLATTTISGCCMY